MPTAEHHHHTRSLHVVSAAYAAGVSGTMAEFMVPPVMPLLHEHFHSSRTIESLFMGAYAALTILSALWGGRLIHRLGTTRVACLGLGWLFLATGLEWYFFRTSTLWGFVASRGVAGIGFGLISVAAPAKIAQEVRPSLVSRAMGIWATWVPVGSLLMFLMAPHLMTTAHIGPLLALEAAMDVVAFVVLASTGFDRIKRGVNRQAHFTLHHPWRNAIIAIALAFASFTFDVFALNTWLSTWLLHDYHWSIVLAGLVGAAGSFLSAGGNLLGGALLSRRAPSRTFFMAVSMAMAVGWSALTMRDLALSIAVVLFINLIGGFIPTLVFLGPNLVVTAESEISHAMAYIIVGENAGIIVGPWVFSLVMGAHSHFGRAFWVLGLVALLMAAAVRQFFVERQKLAKAAVDSSH